MLVPLFKRGTMSRFVSLAVCSLLLSLGLSAAPARADSMRCGDGFVENGSSMYEVQSLCGAPSFTIQRVDYRRFGNAVVQVSIDQWTYDFGPNRFIQTVTFEQGVVVSIVSGHYGTKTQ
jgi:hypothetical protein